MTAFSHKDVVCLLIRFRIGVFASNMTGQMFFFRYEYCHEAMDEVTLLMIYY